MKKLTLSNWERVWLGIMVGSGGGNIAQIRLGYKALDILEFSEEEQKIVGLKRVGLGSWEWDQEYEWELEFPDDIWQLIVMRAQIFQAWPQDPRTDMLYGKVVQDE